MSIPASPKKWKNTSGAEAFSYGLKHQGRATIVGESTRGAAHWSEDFDFPGIGVRACIPIARPVNPVTGTSWEGTGVLPHIPVPSDEALKAALDAARNKSGSR
jgi:C-terminal processing protease CtpA/Prc